MRHNTFTILSLLATLTLCAACQSDRPHAGNTNSDPVSSRYRTQDYYGPETPGGMRDGPSTNDPSYASTFPRDPSGYYGPETPNGMGERHPPSRSNPFGNDRWYGPETPSGMRESVTATMAANHN